MRKWLVGVLGAGLMLGASPAAAKVVTLSYFGSVGEGADDLGVFGGGSLGGQNFVARFVFDTAFVGRETAATYDRIDGAADEGLPSFLSASLEIDGLTWDFAGGVVESVVLRNDQVTATSADGDTIAPPEFLPFVQPGANQITLSLFTHVSPADLELNAAWNATGGVGHFQISSFDTGAGAYVRTYGTLTPARATLDDGTGVGSVVPEPGAWALMILGFGAAGAVLRRRRTAVAAA